MLVIIIYIYFYGSAHEEFMILYCIYYVFSHLLMRFRMLKGENGRQTQIWTLSRCIQNCCTGSVKSAVLQRSCERASPVSLSSIHLPHIDALVLLIIRAVAHRQAQLVLLTALAQLHLLRNMNSQAEKAVIYDPSPAQPSPPPLSRSSHTTSLSPLLCPTPLGPHV